MILVIIHQLTFLKTEFIAAQMWMGARLAAPINVPNFEGIANPIITGSYAATQAAVAHAQ